MKGSNKIWLHWLRFISIYFVAGTEVNWNSYLEIFLSIQGWKGAVGPDGDAGAQGDKVFIDDIIYEDRCFDTKSLLGEPQK